MAWNSAHIDKEFDREVRALLADTDEDGNLPIVQLGEPVLRMQAEQYDGQLSQKTLVKLIELMRSTMLAAPGVGLAGPQIGLGLAIAKEIIKQHKGFIWAKSEYGKGSTFTIVLPYDKDAVKEEVWEDEVED